MRQTLFYIPNEIFGLPLVSPQESNFGFGLLLAIVGVLGGGYLLWRVRRTGFDAEARNNLFVLIAVCAGIVVIAPHLLDRASDDSLGLPVRGYGVMLLFAVLSGVLVAMRRAKQMGLHPDVILSLAMWVFICGIVGARLLYIVRNLDTFEGKAFSEIIAGTANVAKGGLVVYGGLIGGAIGFLIFSIKNKIRVLPFADIVAASLVLGQAIGRLGCLMNGCCFGGVCDLPATAVTFPWGSPPHSQQVLDGDTDLLGIWLEEDSRDPGVTIRDVLPDSAATVAGLQPGDVILGLDGSTTNRNGEFARAFLVAIAGDEPNEINLLVDRPGSPQPGITILTMPSVLPRSQPVYPTQIYGFINGLLFFVFAWFLFPFRRRDGEVFATLLLLFPLTRFLMEVIRTDEPQNFFLGMTISQTISVALSISGVVLWLWLLKQPKGNVAPPEIWEPVNARFVAQ